MTIEWSDPAAKRTYERYLSEIDSLLKVLSEPERQDIRQEIVAHLDDAMADTQTGSESSRIEQAIARVGDPGDFVPDLAAELRHNRQVANGNPMAIALALSARIGSNLLDTAVFAALGLSYLFCIGLLGVSLYSLIDPSAGLWMHSDGGWTLSFEQQAGAKQVLTGWFWLAGSLTAVVGYTLLTQLLKWRIDRTANRALKS